MNLFIDLIISIIGSIIGSILILKYRLIKLNSKLRKILNFGDDEILFIFAHREGESNAILPTIATEDFIAMNNIIGALIKIDWKKPIHFRDIKHIDEQDKKKNLVIIGGCKRNDFTKEFLDEIYKSIHYKIRFLRDKIQINGHSEYPAEPYEQDNNFIGNSDQIVTNSSKIYDDAAIIIKVGNPWDNNKNKIFLLAGIRGIGTWGAAEFLRKEFVNIYDRKSNNNKFKKDGDFIQIIHVKYKNYDIKSTEHIQFIDIT